MATLYTAREGFEEHQGCMRRRVEDAPGRRVEVFHVPEGRGMPLHFHPTRDEVFVFSTRGQLNVGGETVMQTGVPIFVPRGVPHGVEVESIRRSYTVVATGDFTGSTAVSQVPPAEFTYGIYEVDDPLGQTLALQAMNQVGRWQKQGTVLSDP